MTTDAVEALGKAAFFFKGSSLGGELAVEQITTEIKKGKGSISDKGRC